MPGRLFYTIEKIGENQYTVNYVISMTKGEFVKNENMVIETEDIDGVKKTSKINLKPSTIVSLSTSYAANEYENNSYPNIIGGFPVNVSPKNLATGGTYYEIDQILSNN